jgi:hypothetical protein
MLGPIIDTRDLTYYGQRYPQRYIIAYTFIIEINDDDGMRIRSSLLSW